MKQMILVLALIVRVAGPIQAQQGPGDIRAVISGQIEAFLAEDLGRAFSYASPAIRRLFQTADGFGAMVREGYPMVWRPAETRYLGLSQQEGAMNQTLALRDADGAWHLLEYRMIEVNGAWRIDGVRILDGDGIGV